MYGEIILDTGMTRLVKEIGCSNFKMDIIVTINNKVIPVTRECTNKENATLKHDDCN